MDRPILPRVQDRISFLYAERCVVNRDNNAVTFTDERGITHVPAAGIAALMLGPGTKVTYAAMALLGDSGVSVVWVGEKGVRYYASGRSLSNSSAAAEAQASIVSNQRRRLFCARQMYAMRFPGEDISSATMAQLRGREGSRMKKVYLAEAERTGVPWKKRMYDPQNFSTGDPINRTLTAANAALYGVAHAVIVSLGFIPSLGVIHQGTERAFVYDIADLYKSKISIPAAFDAVAENELTADANIRRVIRDYVVKKNLIPTMIRDLMFLMEMTSEAQNIDSELLLWSDLEVVASGHNWSNEGPVE
ncbi:subtype I-E CRISPR-associated endonuclease Cas1 [Corynebacterium sp. HMSC058E07]|uniref:type I-E CRISPR-associated endonuclease Cas1e n=1 Tax=Corynebacterium sp. HMSC058E07 TaxID=1715157 RepID=UPI000551176F|nr:type I-E CRISPR-associated endonuclease Cas1e [Corynebacterium sp. HMSC058E07]OFM60693.1 subtype I-E CRISPR-associated endonuclease Cas1 [Corynebacterium sp. HMSC058E07]